MVAPRLLSSNVMRLSLLAAAGLVLSLAADPGWAGSEWPPRPQSVPSLGSPGAPANPGSGATG